MSFISRHKFTLVGLGIATIAIGILLADQNAALIEAGLGWLVSATKVALSPYFAFMALVYGDAYSGNDASLVDRLLFLLALMLTVITYLALGLVLDRLFVRRKPAA